MKTIISTKVDDKAIDSLIDNLKEVVNSEDVFYTGYPLAPIIDQTITVPALLVSSKFGLVCFDIVASANPSTARELRKRQKEIAFALKSKLMMNPDLQSYDDDDEQELALKINTITYSLSVDGDCSQFHIVDGSSLGGMLANCKAFDPQLTVSLHSSIERMADRPQSKRSPSDPNSKCAVVKQIEAKIANLDSWQKVAAIETPDGPQRIRGLAGTGKTIVLALKAAHLHGIHREWKIVVTFHTRALRQQFEDLINRFYFQDYREKPDSEQLVVMHSFGSSYEHGVYSEICSAYGLPVRDFSYAKRMFSSAGAFQGICAELLREVEKNPKEIFDAILVDEAQDFPKEFFRLAYLCTKNHRIIWAYDDLQNIGDFEMKSLKETFGQDIRGNSLVNLENVDKQPRQDIILPKCYRNPPWTLATAHALGSGIYREQKMVQHPDQPKLWEEIGYRVISGELELGAKVVLERSAEATPDFFETLLNADDAVKFLSFENEIAQYAAVARLIKKDVTEGELFLHDILVIFPNAITAEKQGTRFRQFLADHELDSHLVGVTTSKDIFKVPRKVAVSGPYRAKGNEAPMVYVMDAGFCAAGYELIKKRNILFTAITRSRGWVRVCGFGEGMTILEKEFKSLKDKGFQLDFTIPSLEELQKIRTLFRDITNDEKRQAAEFQKLTEKVLSNPDEASAILQMLPKDVRSKLIKGLKELEDDGGVM